MNDWEQYGPAFEEAARYYGPPALIHDLDQAPSARAKKNILDALALAMRDQLVALHMAQYDSSDLASGPPVKNPGCPLYQAMSKTGMRMDFLNQDLLQGLQDILRGWGQALQPKFLMLQEHYARVKHFHVHYGKEGTTEVRSSSTNVIKSKYASTQGSNKFQWDKLKAMAIRDLKLFDPNASKGCKLVGTLIVDPFTPMVGTTTILEDSNGQVILIALYNFLPEGVQGKAADALAATKIPKGCKVEIAEPFLKIFKNGARGLRIDNPSELRVVSGSKEDDNAPSDEFLADQKKEGNKLFSKGLYHAAVETYLVGLRRDDVTATLLSNRSQAHIQMESYEMALADAAASLTIRPSHKKTWVRYRVALSKLQETFGEEADEEGNCTTIRSEAILSSILARVLEQPTDDVIRSDRTVLQLKEEGNVAFGKQDFVSASKLYSKALAKCEATRAMLSNWALCSLHMNALHDALAASLASLLLKRDQKAMYRLAKALLLIGAPRLTLLFVDHLSQSDPGLIRELGDTAKTFQGRHAFSDLRVALGTPSELAPNWYSPGIATFDAGPKKGRGVRATQSLMEGQPVLVERPIVACETKDDNIVLTTTGRSSINDSSQSALLSAIVLRAQRDVVMTRIIGHLSDGKQPKSVAPFDALLLHLNMTPRARILLPSHFDYYEGSGSEQEETPPRLLAEQVGGIVSVNAHGFNHDGDMASQLAPGKSTELFPGMSMFNHAKNPTCRWMGLKDRCIVVMTRDVKEGEELTVSYHPDDARARQHWGFD